MSNDTHIHRRKDGSINTQFYIERGREARQEQFQRMTRPGPQRAAQAPRGSGVLLLAMVAFGLVAVIGTVG